MRDLQTTLAERLRKVEAARNEALNALADLKGRNTELNAQLAAEQSKMRKLEADRDAACAEVEKLKEALRQIQDVHSACPDTLAQMADAKKAATAAEQRAAGMLDTLRSQHQACPLELRSMSNARDQALAQSEQNVGRLNQVQQLLDGKEDELKLALAAKEIAEKVLANMMLCPCACLLLWMFSCFGQEVRGMALNMATTAVCLHFHPGMSRS